MASVALFENDPEYIDAATRAVEASGHVVDLQVADISDAFGVMRGIIDASLEPDILILDGTLNNENHIRAFEYVHEGQSLIVTSREGLFGQRERTTMFPKTTRLEIDQQRRTLAHARVILDIVDTFNLNVKTIGFSVSSLYPGIQPTVDNGKYPQRLGDDIDRALRKR